MTYSRIHIVFRPVFIVYLYNIYKEISFVLRKYRKHFLYRAYYPLLIEVYFFVLTLEHLECRIDEHTPKDIYNPVECFEYMYSETNKYSAHDQSSNNTPE